MEVEARMKRNYLPPSIQYQGYQGPPTPTGPQPQSVPQSPTQGSITAGLPNYNQQNQKSMKPLLETIPQGSIMGAKGSIMSGSPITQAVSPYTPTMGQFSPSHGAVASQTASLNTGPPVQNQGSIISGTPITNFDRNKNYPSNYNVQNNFGSITSGTPVNNNIGNINSGSFTKNSANSTNYGNFVSTCASNNYPGNSNAFAFGVNATNNFGNTSNIGSLPTGTSNYGNKSQNNYSTGSFGSMTSGLPINQDAQNASMQTESGSNFGSITSGTPINQGVQNKGAQTGSTGNFGSPSNFGSITSGTPINQNPLPTGSITAGTPVTSANYQNNNYNRQRKYSGPQRVKLQMLATVQEMGKLFDFSLRWGGG